MPGVYAQTALATLSALALQNVIDPAWARIAARAISSISVAAEHPTPVVLSLVDADDLPRDTAAPLEEERLSIEDLEPLAAEPPVEVGDGCACEKESATGSWGAAAAVGSTCGVAGLASGAALGRRRSRSDVARSRKRRGRRGLASEATPAW